MDNATNAKRSAQLGMSHSTARSRLVKMLLFRELQESANNFCYKCQEEIDDIDHLSIEHKIPWLDVDPALYWDLDNIAYSHVQCNRPHRYHGASVRYPDKDGNLWCSGHKQYEPAGNFNKHSTNRRGLQSMCREETVRRKREARGRGAAVVAGGS